MAGLEMPVAPWDKAGDAPVMPTRGGLLDGLPEFDAGDGLSVLMEPKDIAKIGVPTTVSDSAALIDPPSMPVFDQGKQSEMAVPPGVSVDKNMERAQQAVNGVAHIPLPPDPVAYGLMTQLFSPDHEMDYKRGGHPEFRDFGNYNYGAVGSATGLTPYELHSAAGAVQMLQNHWEPSYGVPYLVPPFGDNRQDYEKIDEGIAYQRAHHGK